MRDRIQGFLNFLQSDKGYADNTIAAYQNDLNQFFQHIHAGESQPENWTQVKKDDIIGYIDQLKNSGDYASSTVARKVAALKSFFHFLVAEKDLSEDPTIALDPPKVKKRLPKAISPDDIERLLQAPAGQTGPKAQRDLALLEMLYASGMRVTELVSLNTTDINIDDQQNCTVRVKGKRASAKERHIPITDSALAALQHYLENGREQLLQDPDEVAVFLNNRGQRLTRQGLWLIIKYYVEAVSISTEVTPHTLRHSFAAHKLSQGKSLQDIQKLLGHANISTTQVYTHLSQEGEKTPQ